MLTSKQRAGLRALANPLKATLQIGKDGITQGVIDQLEDQLESRELVKVQLLESAMLSARDTLDALSQQLKAEPVQAIGTKMVLYRPARNPDKRKIVLAK